MDKLVLADDDPLILEALKLVVERTALGFTVVGTARNGAEALEKIHGTVPDIVITDIKMPVMDGIALMQQLQAEKNRAKVVVLSAYREFEYAQQALKYGAADYLLKPLTEVKVREVLRKVQELVAAERSQLRQLEELQRVTDENMKSADREFLRKSIRVPVDPRALREKLSQGGLMPLSRQCRVLSITVHTDVVPADSSRLEEYVTGINNSFRGRGVAFDNSGASRQEIVLLMKPEIDRRLVTEQLLMHLEGLHDMPAPPVIGSSDGHEWENLRIAYEEAVFARDYAAFTGTAAAAFETVRHLQYLHQGDLFASEEDLIQKISLGLKEEALGILGQMFAKLRADRNLNPEIIYKSCYEMVVLLKRACSKLRKREEFISLLEMIDEDSLRRNVNMEDLHHYLENLVTTIVAGIQNLRREDDERLIAKAMQYCREHLGEDITLDIIADYICFNKNYFCSFFKRKTGQNFSDYLTGLRLAKAKELLGGTEMKVNRVAEMVGYKNASHFGKVFKDEVGMTPAEYKDKYQK